MNTSNSANGADQFIENSPFLYSVVDEECYFCSRCNVKCTGLSSFQQHIAGAKHERTLKSPIICSLCNANFNSQAQYELHVNGTKHKRKIQMSSCVVPPVNYSKSAASNSGVNVYISDTKLQKIMDLEAAVSKKIDFHSSSFASVHSTSCPKMKLTGSGNFPSGTFFSSSSSPEDKVHHIFCENKKCVILRAIKHYEDFLCSHCPTDSLFTTSGAQNLSFTD